MGFRFIISDPYWGGMIGTDDEDQARTYALSDDYFVVDTSDNTQINPDQGKTPIKQAEKIESGETKS